MGERDAEVFAAEWGRGGEERKVKRKEMGERFSLNYRTSRSPFSNKIHNN